MNTHVRSFEYFFRSVGLEEMEIMWVLTVPTIWDDEKKQFMREAAQMVSNLSKYLCF